MLTQHLIAGRHGGGTLGLTADGPGWCDRTALVEAKGGCGQARGIAEEGRALDHVGQLPDIARPRMGT